MPRGAGFGMIADLGPEAWRLTFDVVTTPLVQD